MLRSDLHWSELAGFSLRRPESWLSLAALLHHSPLRDSNIVPGAVLDHVHHFVGLADDVVRSFRIMGIGCQTNRRAHVQVQAFVFAEGRSSAGCRANGGQRPALNLFQFAEAG